jgi:hypothetical protein
MQSPDWRSLVSDAKHAEIFEALEDPRWEWRTVSALARASGLDVAEVLKVLNSYLSLVRRSPTPGPQGEDLYTLQSRYFERKNPLQRAWDFLSPPSSSSSSS